MRRSSTSPTLVGRLTGAPLVGGNRVEPLTTGADVYAAMREAFDQAQSSNLALDVHLRQRSGRARVRRRARSREGPRRRRARDRRRGRRPLQLPDRRSRCSTRAACAPSRSCRAASLPCSSPLNLRTHRKIVVVDGTIAFTGGMNIREGHTLIGGSARDPGSALPLDGADRHAAPAGLRDRLVLLHGRGARGRRPGSRRWSRRATSLARGIPDGPDEDFDKLRLTLLGALACAERSVVDRDAVLHSGSDGGHGARGHGPSRRPRRHPPAGAIQSADRSVGDVGPLRGAREEGRADLAHAPAVRSLEAHGRRRSLVALRLGELGRAQPRAALRDERRVLRREARGDARPAHRGEAEPRAAGHGRRSSPIARCS